MPAGYGFGFIFRFPKDLTLENQDGIAAKNGIHIPIRRRIQSLMHRSCLGGGQAKHQFSRIGFRNGAFINATDSQPMSNAGLFKQPVSGLRRRSKQQQGELSSMECSVGCQCHDVLPSPTPSFC